jgi:Icc-related predicted phosphoesterase
MRVCLISDTHELHEGIELPSAELLIHCGDFTNRGDVEAITDFNRWLGQHKHKYRYGILLTCGNHERKIDPANKDYIPDLKRLITNATILENSGVRIRGYRIWGSPYTPDHGTNWSYVYKRGEGTVWKQIPVGTDILITHGPAAGILDKSSNWSSGVGCADLKDAVRRIRPIMHVFGHIHGSHGKMRTRRGTLSVNASIVGEPLWEMGIKKYERKYEPIVVTVPSLPIIVFSRILSSTIAYLERLRNKLLKS